MSFSAMTFWLNSKGFLCPFLYLVCLFGVFFSSSLSSNHALSSKIIQHCRSQSRETSVLAPASSLGAIFVSVATSAATAIKNDHIDTLQNFRSFITAMPLMSSASPIQRRSLGPVRNSVKRLMTWSCQTIRLRTQRCQCSSSGS